jgi:multidrug efflux system outer membrane protein
MRATCAALVVLLLSACTVGPNYKRPDVVSPAAWRIGAPEAESISNAAWWEQFDDPVLTKLVHQALLNNQDLAVAAARVDQAYAQFGIVRSAQFPQVDGGASAGRERGSANAIPPGGFEFNNYSLGLSAGFEIDIWGRLRRATESARASLLASEEGRRTVVLTLVSSVAAGYIQLRAYDRQLEIARQTSAALGEAARIQRIRFEAGAVPESDYRQAQSQYTAAAQQVPELERLIARQENFLSVLLGTNPGPIERGRAIDALQYPVVPAGLPADLLEQRPDIRAAEQNLVAANANIGVAKAAYYPRISLTGFLGLESTELSDLFKGPSKTWSYGLGVTVPIFNAGRIHNQVLLTEAQQREALAQYRQSIMVAFEDVDDALVDRAKLARSREISEANVAALTRFRDLAALRYREGATIYLEVANAEQSLFNAQLAYVATQSQLFQSYAGIYKAMGGAWVADADALTASNHPQEKSP